MTYTVENLQLAFRTHTNKVFPLRGRILLFFGLLLLWTGIILLLINITQAVKPAYVFYILAGIIFIAVHYITVSRLGKQAYAKLKERSSVEYHFLFDENGFEISANNTSQVYKWIQIEKAVLNDKLLMLYVSKQTFYFLMPQHITIGSFNSLCDIVKTNVKTVL